VPCHETCSPTRTHCRQRGQGSWPQVLAASCCVLHHRALATSYPPTTATTTRHHHQWCQQMPLGREWAAFCCGHSHCHHRQTCRSPLRHRWTRLATRSWRHRGKAVACRVHPLHPASADSSLVAASRRMPLLPACLRESHPLARVVLRGHTHTPHLTVHTCGSSCKTCWAHFYSQKVGKKYCEKNFFVCLFTFRYDEIL
jgi:hypothetical protein